MMRFPKLDKLQIWHLDAIGAGVALLLAGVAYLLLIQPLIDASRLRQAQAAELIAEQTKRQDAEKALRASEDQLANVQAYITDLKLPLEPTTRMNEHLSGLTELAIKCGLQVDAVEPGKEDAGAFFTTVSIKLNGKASYRNFVTFLKRLREVMPDHTATQMELSAQPSPVDTTATFSLSLTWYAAPRSPLAQNP